MGIGVKRFLGICSKRIPMLLSVARGWRNSGTHRPMYPIPENCSAIGLVGRVRVSPSTVCSRGALILCF